MPFLWKLLERVLVSASASPCSLPPHQSFSLWPCTACGEPFLWVQQTLIPWVSLVTPLVATSDRPSQKTTQNRTESSDDGTLASATGILERAMYHLYLINMYLASRYCINKWMFRWTLFDLRPFDHKTLIKDSKGKSVNHTDGVKYFDRPWRGNLGFISS